MSARSTQPGQAVVEFGIISLLFVLLMFAVADLGLLLNTWVRLSAAAREVGRGASVGYSASNVHAMVDALALPGVNRATLDTFSGYCCGESGNDKLVVSIAYYGCPPGGGCPAFSPGEIDRNYWGGTCSSGCAHPVRGDTIVVSIAAPGMEVITPLVRPFFGCNNNSVHCYVRLGSTATMRYEGT